MLLKLWVSWRYGDRVIDILIWYGFHDGRIIDILITRSSALKCISSDVGRLAIEQTLTFNPIQVVQILINMNDENDDDVKLWWYKRWQMKNYEQGEKLHSLVSGLDMHPQIFRHIICIVLFLHFAIHSMILTTNELQNFHFAPKWIGKCAKILSKCSNSAPRYHYYSASTILAQNDFLLGV